MTEGVLIAILGVLWIGAVRLIYRRDPVASLSFGMLFLYSWVALIGYAYFPSLSATQSVYFGKAVFVPAWLFICLSCCACFLGFELFPSLVLVRLSFRKHDNPLAKALFLALMAGFLLFVDYQLWRHAPQMHYGMLAAEIDPAMARFMYAARLFASLLIPLYAACGQGRLRGLAWALFVPGVCTCAAVAAASGARSDLLYAALGIAAYRLSGDRGRKGTGIRRMAGVVCAGIVFSYALLTLEYVRVRYAPISLDAYWNTFIRPSIVFSSKGSLEEAILAKDYYWPIHLLFAAINGAIVIPGKVIASNVANTFVGFGVPYITEFVSAKAVGASDRTNGFAFHVFVEGFLAAGWLGWIYNSVVWNGSMAVLRTFRRTTSPSLNRVGAAVALFYIPGLVRSQSSATLKMAWSLIIPTFAMAVLGLGFRPGVEARARK